MYYVIRTLDGKVDGAMVRRCNLDQMAAETCSKGFRKKNELAGCLTTLENGHLSLLLYLQNVNIEKIFSSVINLTRPTSGKD